MNRTTLSAFITNLGKYTEGELVGKWVVFPITNEELQEVLQEIGINGIRYEEIFFTDYESDIDGLSACLGEYESIRLLNCLATKIEESDCDTEELAAMIEYGEYTGSIEELLTLVDNTDCYLVYRDIQDDSDLGHYLIEEMGLLQDWKASGSPLANYIDYEAYGRDVRLEQGGVLTENGYYVALIDTPTEYTREELQEIYSSCGIAAWYRVGDDVVIQKGIL